VISLYFYKQNSPFGISRTQKDSAFKFSVVIDTINIGCLKFSKLRDTPEFSPREV